MCHMFDKVRVVSFNSTAYFFEFFELFNTPSRQSEVLSFRISRLNQAFYQCLSHVSCSYNSVLGHSFKIKCPFQNSLKGALVWIKKILSLQYTSRNNNPLYFTCAFVYLCDFCVSHQSFYMVFFHVSISTVNLDGFSGYCLSNTGCK